MEHTRREVYVECTTERTLESLNYCLSSIFAHNIKLCVHTSSSSPSPPLIQRRAPLVARSLFAGPEAVGGNRIQRSHSRSVAEKVRRSKYAALMEILDYEPEERS
ncbi:hypothetical protein RB195_026013 [Necator americanus]|uniref:BHLH domain-containing protein n=1 Tax=Necator americanus TaxID=51031 RepID=A0ABR1EV07_NECAM